METAEREAILLMKSIVIWMNLLLENLEQMNSIPYPFAQSALRTCAIWRSLPHIAKNIIKIHSITRA